MDITTATVKAFLETQWKLAYEIFVESLKIDSEGNYNAWVEWKMDQVNLDGVTVTEYLKQNVKLHETSNGSLELI